MLGKDFFCPGSCQIKVYEVRYHIMVNGRRMGEKGKNKAWQTGG